LEGIVLHFKLTIVEYHGILKLLRELRMHETSHVFTSTMY